MCHCRLRLPQSTPLRSCAGSVFGGIIMQETRLYTNHPAMSSVIISAWTSYDTAPFSSTEETRSSVHTANLSSLGICPTPSEEMFNRRRPKPAKSSARAEHVQLPIMHLCSLTVYLRGNLASSHYGWQCVGLGQKRLYEVRDCPTYCSEPRVVVSQEGLRHAYQELELRNTAECW